MKILFKIIESRTHTNTQMRCVGNLARNKKQARISFSFAQTDREDTAESIDRVRMCSSLNWILLRKTNSNKLEEETTVSRKGTTEDESDDSLEKKSEIAIQFLEGNRSEEINDQEARHVNRIMKEEW